MEWIRTKLSSKTESSQDVRVENCSWCGENGHNALWCPHNSNQEEGFEHINMVNGGYYGNQGQPRRQPYIPQFKQQQQWQPNQQQGWNNDDDALDTILQALDDLKEGSNQLESKLEDLSSRIKRLEAKEKQ